MPRRSTADRMQIYQPSEDYCISEIMKTIDLPMNEALPEKGSSVKCLETEKLIPTNSLTTAFVGGFR